MIISIVVANRAVVDPLVPFDDLRAVGTIWGSWHQWHQCLPHHVVCHDMSQAKRLIAGGFHSWCELFVPETVFNALGKPKGVKSYGGEFLHEIPNPEELVAVHLAAATADIVVLVDFDWSVPNTVDPVVTHVYENRMSVLTEAIREAKTVQWIVVGDSVPQQLVDFDNVDHDTLQNIISA